MLMEGVSPALIENAARHAGYPVGPLAVQDETSIELGYKIHLQTIEDMGDAYKPASGWKVSAKLVEQDRLGKKYGKGFYDYPEGEPKRDFGRVWRRCSLSAMNNRMLKRSNPD